MNDIELGWRSFANQARKKIGKIMIYPKMNDIELGWRSFANQAKKNRKDNDLTKKEWH
jgi:hypothetical protein